MKLWILPALALGLFLLPQDPVEPPADDPPRDDDAVVAVFADAGLRLDLDLGLVALPARVGIKHDLLEYLLTGPGGQTHETLLVTDVLPSLLNTALLTLGVDHGENARWVERDPAPTEEERAAGVDPYELFPPQGDGFFLHVAWREGGERFLFRVEDLIANLADGRAMKRHRWVYLGSRFAQLRADQPEVFVADAEQNLINITFFHEGNTLITGSRPECADQSIWLANAWLVPPAGSPVQLVIAREPLQTLPDAWWDGVTELVVAPSPGPGGR